MRDAGTDTRWRQVAVASVLLLVQVVALAHLVVVPHERCPEHGEAVHDTSGEEPRPRLLAPLVATDDVLARDVPDPEHEDDEHCRLLAERRNHGVDALPLCAPLLLERRTSTWRRIERVSPAAALFRLAPKASPPG